jgi:uncharacterized protein RhaS with RHS repeats
LTGIGAIPFTSMTTAATPQPSPTPPRRDDDHLRSSRQSLDPDRCAGNTTRFTYDEHGNLIERIDALGNTASWPTTATARSSHHQRRQSDHSVRLRLGRQYDDDYRRSRRNHCHTYDAVGRQITETDPLGRTTTYTYDDADTPALDTRSRSAASPPTPTTPSAIAPP